MILETFRLAFKNLSRRKTRSYLTMIGIFIGIAAVVALIGLGEGLRDAVTAQFGFLGTDMLTIQAEGAQMMGPPGSNTIKPLEKDMVKEIEDVPGVKSAFGRYIESARIRFDDDEPPEVGIIASAPAGDDRKIFNTMLNLEAEEGRLLKDGDRGVLLGYNFMKTEDNIDGLTTKNNLIIDDREYDIIGFTERAGSFIIDNTVLMNEDVMEDRFDINEEVDVIAVKVENVDEIDKVKQNIEKELRKLRHVDEGEEDFTVETPESTLESLNSTLFAIQLFVTIIAFISILVGGIGITNTMYTAVLERTKEIGILKSVGASNASIFSIFLFESGLLGSVGGTVGILMGAGAAYGSAFLARELLSFELLQAHVSISLVVGALLFSFIIGSLSGLLPAYQAAKKNPVDALRFSK